MLRNKLGIMNKVVFVALLGLFVCATDLFAAVNIKQGWSETSSGLTWGISDYLLAGCSDPDNFTTSCHGTYGDEGAIVVNIARKFNDRGGYFCPTQLQVGNTNKKKQVWFNFYEPVDSAPCTWICKDGYKGNECAETDDGSDVGTTSLTLLKKGTMRTSGGGSNKVSDTVDVFDIMERLSDSDDRDTWMHVLAILKYLDHGVLVGHLWVYGKRNWEGAWYSSHNCESWITRVHGEHNNGREYLLCDKGYKQNADKTDCVPINPDAVPKPWCNGWTEQEYKAKETDFIKKQIGSGEGACNQYRCSDRNKAFPNESNRTCEPCSTGVRGGASPTTGVCKRCDLGQYYDSNSDTCKSALGLSKQDLQYGKGKANNGNPKDQCWTKTDPEAYKCCVINDAQACGRAKQNGTYVTSGFINDRASYKSADVLQVSKQSFNKY